MLPIEDCPDWRKRKTPPSVSLRRVLAAALQNSIPLACNAEKTELFVRADSTIRLLSESSLHSF